MSDTCTRQHKHHEVFSSAADPQLQTNTNLFSRDGEISTVSGTTAKTQDLLFCWYSSMQVQHWNWHSSYRRNSPASHIRGLPCLKFWKGSCVPSCKGLWSHNPTKQLCYQPFWRTWSEISASRCQAVVNHNPLSSQFPLAQNLSVQTAATARW